MDLDQMTASLVAEAGLTNATLDVVAIGKASREMTSALARALGEKVRRQIVVCDEASPLGATTDVVVGEHPVPGEGSLRAGRAVLSFLDRPSDAGATLFLISGGASSLCVVPAEPLLLEDLLALWAAALRAGADITTLNKIRAVSSVLSGGAVLRHVSTERSCSFILVDNVVSGATWVASAMTYDYQPTEEDVRKLWAGVGVTDSSLVARLLAAFRTRARIMERPPRTRHDNRVLGEPAMMLHHAIDEASRRGYRVIDMGSHIAGDGADVAREWSQGIEHAPPGPVALVGVGEVTVKVTGAGEGGRGQELAWLMADVLQRSGRAGVFVAQASDGRDHVEGVGGAWVDQATLSEAASHGIDWAEVARTHDTYPALRTLGHLIEGHHTGWNLCDIYVAALA